MILSKASAFQETTFAKRSEYWEKISLILKQQGKSKAWLANKIGISKQAINYLINHSSTPKYMNEIASVLEINPEWLLLNKGPQQLNLEKNTGIIDIPILAWNDIGNFIKQKATLLAKEFTHLSVTAGSSQCFATVLENSSMEPLFSHGSLLIFNPDIIPQNSDYIIFSDKQNIFFRQYFIEGKEIYLKTFDVLYKAFTINEIMIFGVLIESRKHFK